VWFAYHSPTPVGMSRLMLSSQQQLANDEYIYIVVRVGLFL